MEASSRSDDVVAKEESKKDRSRDGDELFEREVLVKIGNGKMSHDSNDKKSHSNNQELHSNNQVTFVTKMEKSSVELDSMTSSSSRNDQDEELESARVEMGEVREENQRLKICLDQIMKNYRMLQMQFNDIVRQDGKKNTMPPVETCQEVEETDLVALTLGRFPSAGKTISENIMNSHKLIKENDQQFITQDLALGLDSKFDGSRLSDKIKDNSPKGRSPSSNSNEEVKEGEGEDPWPPNKGLKTMRSGEDEVMQQNPPKKARVCVRARCDTPTMNDGCQWRKYGQKIAKGNPCPRAYYRCTGAQSCPVRKQVQRCAEDMSILITTYEGTHNHPLSVTATAMASTTSAAAAMLLSGSSTSQFSPNPSATTATTTPANLHGSNFYLSDNSNSKQFYLPSSSISSSSPTHPTITIDLTSNPASSSSASASSSSNFGRLFSSPYPPRYPFTNLDFGSSQSNLMSWGNGLLGYGNQLPYNRSQMGTLDIGTYMPKTNNVTAAAAPPRHPLPDPITAATKAITADPSFQSALAAALTSFIGNGASGSGTGESFLEKLKWVEKFQLGSSTQKGNGCGSNFINATPATNSQHGNLTFLPSNSSPFSTSKSASTSPGDNRDHQPS